jgi:NRAMP (natural resistance-associated macrophage protein)-like metal ion transporter
MPLFRHVQDFANKLGPGLITGAADDDPSGIATYSQAGAQYGAGLLWSVVFTTPLMIGVQMISARIGWVTGQGLGASLLRVFPRWMAITLISLLVVANTLNIGADIAAMSEASNLMIGGPEHGQAILFGLLCAVFPILFAYERMVRIFKWLTLALLSYVAVILALHTHWNSVLPGTLWPKLQSGRSYWMMVVAVLGTTISPYLFFWQATQEAELRQRISRTDAGEPSTAFMGEHLYRIKLDTTFGMGFSNFIAFCIMLATALTLNLHGITDIQTARQAAEALRPIAGDFAFLMFSLGIIGTGLLAVPILAGSAAYAVADLFKWRAGLDHRLTEARGFYGVLITATVIGTLLDFAPIDAIQALIWSAIANGIIAVPIMIAMMVMATRHDVLGRFILSRRHQVLGWLATVTMAAAVLGMAWDILSG